MSLTLYDSLRVLVLGGHARAVSVNTYRVRGNLGLVVVSKNLGCRITGIKTA